MNSEDVMYFVLNGFAFVCVLVLLFCVLGLLEGVAGWLLDLAREGWRRAADMLKRSRART